MLRIAMVLQKYTVITVITFQIKKETWLAGKYISFLFLVIVWKLNKRCTSFCPVFHSSLNMV